MLSILKPILFLSLTCFIVDTIRPMIRDDAPKSKRDYRPSKWITNSALDIWYGNKSMVDVFAREFTELMDRITLRQLRSIKENYTSLLNFTKEISKEKMEKLLRLNKTIFIE